MARSRRYDQIFFSSLGLFSSSGRLVSSDIFKNVLTDKANPYTGHAASKIAQSAASRTEKDLRARASLCFNDEKIKNPAHGNYTHGHGAGSHPRIH